MKTSKKTKFLILLLSFGILFFGHSALAQTTSTDTAQENCDMFYNWFSIGVEKPEHKTIGPDGKPTNPNAVSGLPKFCTAQQIIGWVIDRLLLFAGSVAVIFIIIGGFRYVTSGGNEEAAESGKKTLVTSVIGLVAIVLAATIVKLVVSTLGTGQKPASTTTETSAPTQSEEKPAEESEPQPPEESGSGPEPVR